MYSCWQNWFAFSKPLSTELGSIDFQGTNNANPPPLDENNNAYCKVPKVYNLLRITFVKWLVVKIIQSLLKL